jgi:N utilization substance protein B
MELTRNKQQEIAMSIIYQALLRLDMNEELDIKSLISENVGLPYDEVDLYVKRIVVAAILHKDEAIDAFSKNMNKWKFSRLSMLMQAILLLSYAHFYFVKDSEKGVIINVAVVLAKKYLSDKDYKFINGVLESTLNV